MNVIITILISVLYLSIIFLISNLIYNKVGLNIKLNGELSRKFIHIMAGNWIFIPYYFLGNSILSIFAGLGSVFLNVYILKSKKFKFITRYENYGKKDYSIVYYSFSIFLLMIFSYLLKDVSFACAGILVMAYGDGLAAIFGKMYGKSYNFDKIDNKSFVGSFVLFCTTFIILFILNHYIGIISMPMCISIALFSTIVELFSTDGLDNITLPITVFVLYYYFRNSDIAIYFVSYSVMLFLIFAFLFEALDNLAVITAFIVGITLYYGGGGSLIFSIVLFFVLGTLITKITNKYKLNAKLVEEVHESRNSVQVLANSLPAVILIWISILFNFDRDLILISSFVCIAASSADTFASEIGMFSKKDPISIITFKKVRPGLSGGVTFLGLISSIFGSFLVSILVLLKYNFRVYLFVSILGFISSVLDSVLGALLQVKYIDEEGNIFEKKLNNGIELKKYSGISFIDNNMVNILSNLIVTFLSFILMYKFFGGIL